MNPTSLEQRSPVILGLGLSLVLAVPLTGSGQDNDTCLTCHGDAEVFEADQAHLVVDADVYASSIHGSMEMDCVDCHADLSGAEDFPHESPPEAPACGDCHEDAVAAVEGSIHGYARLREMTSSARGREAPSCASCHGTHDILPSDDPASRSHRSRVAETCASCHGQEVLPANGFVRFAEVVDAYARSVHGQSASAGSTEAATCTDCHGHHELRGSFDSASPIHPRNVAHTCGGCHAEIADQYSASIHGRALEAGVTDSPTCTSCHGEHLILAKDGPEARTHASNLASATCGECHDDPRMAAKYGLSDDVVSSYIDSNHGWATQREWDRAATCIKCHTAHEVLPASDPSSTVHADRVVQTCGACHEGADAAFAASYTHASASITVNPVNRWIRIAYLFLIGGTIGGMLLPSRASHCVFPRPGGCRA